ncbi:hypothetical protein CAEBREN_01494 [Caenorhabditis brenneri]|uniref:Knottin scorpion toxin-like domain-containing protein n=1 Tax=Caenorhabditis brenneri TaxID=135651 RepID=G0PJI5_CAEBE|nr:hypothetical protein CAEBREN_01494 [Caenorhabditis brenneri]
MKQTQFFSLLLLVLLVSEVLAKIDIHQDGWGWCTDEKCNQYCEQNNYNFGICEWYLLIRSKCLCTNLNI